MSLSVVIPCFNVSEFVDRSIQSALAQPEVTEVLAIDDGSTDDTLAILQGLATIDPRLKVLRHVDGQNHGRSASRNLGILAATGDYVAFLDADDYYLEKRFDGEIARFESESKIDGIYSAIGSDVRDPSAEKASYASELMTITRPVDPEDLFYTMSPFGDNGYFSLNGLTVKRSCFDISGLFVEELATAEDTHLILRMALTCSLWPGVLDRPCALRVVHKGNVFHKSEIYAFSRVQMFESLYEWAKSAWMPARVQFLFLKQIYLFRQKRAHVSSEPTTSFARFWIMEAAKNPVVRYSRHGWIYCLRMIRHQSRLWVSRHVRAGRRPATGTVLRSDGGQS